MKTKVLFITVAILLALAPHPVAAQPDRIPETSGFSGYATLAVAYWQVSSSMIVRGTPILLKDVSDTRIDSIFDKPTSNSAPGVLIGGEVNYTFARTRTQLFLGNSLEDLLRMDVVSGLGVRQEIGRAGILSASFLMTPVDLEVWSDPYVEGRDRLTTEVDIPGFRVRWGEIFGTGLEFTINNRFYSFDNERSGQWLVSEGRLEPEQRSLLDRNGDILQIQAAYRFNLKDRHHFVPAVMWVNDKRDGRAVSNDGFSFKLTYLFLSPSVILDANIQYGFGEAKEANPIYGRVWDADRISLNLKAFLPVKRYSNSVLSVFVGGEFFEEITNIDFYDTSVSMFMVGMVWRHTKK